MTTKLRQFINQTRIDKVATPPAAPSSSTTKLGAILANGPRGEVLEVPGLGRVRVELIGVRDSQEVEGATHATFRDLGLKIDVTTGLRVELERATRTLAIAVRDPDDRTKPLGTLDEWRAIDPDLACAAWQVYGDLRERLNPIGDEANEVELEMIAAAVARKDKGALMSYGVAKLASFIESRAVAEASADVPPATTGDA